MGAAPRRIFLKTRLLRVRLPSGRGSGNNHNRSDSMYMTHRSRLVQLSLALPVDDYSAFLTAVRLLVRRMGVQAPDVVALLVHTLRRRDAAGLVEDYLEAVDWPVKLRKVARDARRSTRTRGARRSLFAASTAVDPSRN